MQSYRHQSPSPRSPFTQLSLCYAPAALTISAKEPSPPVPPCITVRVLQPNCARGTLGRNAAQTLLPAKGFWLSSNLATILQSNCSSAASALAGTASRFRSPNPVSRVLPRRTCPPAIWQGRIIVIENNTNQEVQHD